MSGHSGDTPCPRCGKTADTYDDYKPHTVTRGTCPYCGYFWHTAMEVMSDEERAEARDEHEEIIGEKLTWPTDGELNLEMIKRFDKRFSPEIRPDIQAENQAKVIREYVRTLFPSRHDYLPHDEEKFDTITTVVENMLEFIQEKFPENK